MSLFRRKKPKFRHLGVAQGLRASVQHPKLCNPNLLLRFLKHDGCRALGAGRGLGDWDVLTEAPNRVSGLRSTPENREPHISQTVCMKDLGLMRANKQISTPLIQRSMYLESTYLWLVGNGGMGYNYNYYYYHSSIPY